MMNVSNSNVYSVPRKRGTEQSSDTQTVLRTSVDTPLDTPWIPCLDISCFNKTSDIIRFAPVQKDLA